MRTTAVALARNSNADLAAIGRRLDTALIAYDEAVDYLVSHYKSDIRAAFAGSVPYLKLAGIVHGGWQMARAALAAEPKAAAGVDRDFMLSKIVTARFFADHMLSCAPGLRASIVEGSRGVLGLPIEQF